MSSGGPRKPGTPKDGQPRFKQLSGVYRSVEGALGQALRLSRRTGGKTAAVWVNGAGEFVVLLAMGEMPNGCSLVSEVKAFDAAAA